MAEVSVFADLAELSEAAAEQFAALANSAVKENGRFLVALSGGSTPNQLFSRLSQPPYAHAAFWANSHIFWGDERLVPPDDEGSSYKQAVATLLQQVPIPPQQIHRVKGEWDGTTAVNDYAQQLQKVAPPGRAWPRFDLVLLGLGNDGHTASLFPGPIPPAENEQPVIAVTAHYEDRPAQRVSLTPLVFNDAKTLLFLVSGGSKAEALTAVLHQQDNSEKWPAQRIKPHNGQLLWFVDKAAASKLTSVTTNEHTIIGKL